MSLTYERKDRYANAVKSARMVTEHIVRLDGKVVGKIVEKGDGFQYVPSGQKRGGKIFPTLRLCQASLHS